MSSAHACAFSVTVVAANLIQQNRWMAINAAGQLILSIMAGKLDNARGGNDYTTVKGQLFFFDLQADRLFETSDGMSRKLCMSVLLICLIL